MNFIFWFPLFPAEQTQAVKWVGCRLPGFYHISVDLLFMNIPNLLLGENWAVRKTGYSQELYICWQTGTWQHCLGANTQVKSPEQESAAVTLACWRLAQFSLFTLKRRKIKSSWMRCTAGYRVCLLVQRMVAASIKHEIFVCSLLECLGRFQNLIGIVLFRIRIQAADWQIASDVRNCLVIYFCQSLNVISPPRCIYIIFHGRKVSIVELTCIMTFLGCAGPGQIKL